MAIDHVVGKTELYANFAHLVFEEFTQWFYQTHLHVFGQSAYVVVRFDDMRLTRLGDSGLDYVGVNSPLREPLYIGEFAGLGVEHLDEGITNYFALRLGVFDTGELAEEEVFGVGANDLNPHILGKSRHHLIALVEAQQTVVDENAHELITNRFVQQRRDDRRIDAAGKTE